MKQNIASAKAISPDLPEWARQIVVRVTQDVRPRKVDSQACSECSALLLAARADGQKVKWWDHTCPIHPLRQITKIYEEEPEQFNRFLLYRDALDQPSGKPPTLRQIALDNGLDASQLRWIETLSSRFRWIERRAAMKIADKQQQAEQRRRRQELRFALNEERREEVLDMAYECGRELIKRGKDMLKMPIFETKVEKGGKTIIYKPVPVRQNDIPRFFAVGQELMKFGAEIERRDGSRQSAEVEEESEVAPVEMSAEAQ